MLGLQTTVAVIAHGRVLIDATLMWICTPPRFDWLGLHRNAGNVAGDKQIADVNGRARGINFHPDFTRTRNQNLALAFSPRAMPGSSEITPAMRSTLMSLFPINRFAFHLLYDNARQYISGLSW